MAKIKAGDRIHCVSEKDRKHIKTSLEHDGIKSIPEDKDGDLWLKITEVEQND